jgi:hypothetical protein
MAPLIGGRFVLEDCHPSGRLGKIVEAMKEELWSDDDSAMQMRFVQNVMHRAGLISPITIAQSITRFPLNGPDSWGTDARLRHVPKALRMDDYFQYVEEEITENLMKRTTDPLAGIYRSESLIRFPLEIYSDGAVFNHTPRIDRLGYPLIQCKMYQHAIANLIILSLLEDGDVSDTERIEKGFIHGIKETMKSEGRKAKIPKLWRAKGIAQAVCGRFTHLLSWS